MKPMKKTPKSYRLSQITLSRLQSLKELPKYANYTETDLVELAVLMLYFHHDDLDPVY